MRPSPGASFLITTGAPLMPRCRRASVRKQPLPWKRMPKDEAIEARLATGRRCSVS
ncbi:hypothetical protein D3C83_202810 [compost metagenome]